MIRSEDMRSGQNLAFFGSHDDENWLRIGAAVRSADGRFSLASGELIGPYRWVKMESEPPVMTCYARLQGSEA